jgi:hypothetical protein
MYLTEAALMMTRYAPDHVHMQTYTSLIPELHLLGDNLMMPHKIIVINFYDLYYNLVIKI